MFSPIALFNLPKRMKKTKKGERDEKQDYSWKRRGGNHRERWFRSKQSSICIPDYDGGKTLSSKSPCMLPGGL